MIDRRTAVATVTVRIVGVIVGLTLAVMGGAAIARSRHPDYARNQRWRLVLGFVYLTAGLWALGRSIVG